MQWFTGVQGYIICICCQRKIRVVKVTKTRCGKCFFLMKAEDYEELARKVGGDKILYKPFLHRKGYYYCRKNKWVHKFVVQHWAYQCKHFFRR